MQTETICDIPIYSGTKDDVLLEIHKLLKTNGQHIVTTPNPEMLVHAYKDLSFKNILQNSSLAVCDGGGIALMSRGAVSKFSGVDLMHAICKIAADKSLSIYLLGSGDTDTVTQAADNLRAQYLNLSIAGIHAGPRLTDTLHSASLEEHSHGVNDAVLADILEKKPDILFVGFGHSKQEKWIVTYLNTLPSVKIAMGVGGSIDFIAEKIARAPQTLRRFHLEWLWRLIKQPKRIKRIVTAVFIFPYYYVTKK